MPNRNHRTTTGPVSQSVDRAINPPVTRNYIVNQYFSSAFIRGNFVSSSSLIWGSDLYYIREVDRTITVTGAPMQVLDFRHMLLRFKPDSLKLTQPCILLHRHPNYAVFDSMWNSEKK